jgi:copper chaperone NosL
MLLVITGLSCSTEPEPINFGTDQCYLCKMNISDTRFGAEIVNNKGKAFKFDAAECMFNAVSVDKISKADIEKYYVIDAVNSLIDASTAFYLISDKLPSPMGANLSAYSKKEDAEKYLKEYGGQVFSFNDLMARFKVQ